MNYRRWSKVFFVLMFFGSLSQGFSMMSYLPLLWKGIILSLATAFQLVWLYAIIQYNRTKPTRYQVIMLNRIGVLLLLPLLLSPFMATPAMPRELFGLTIPHARMLVISLVMVYFSLLLAWSTCVFVQIHKKWYGARKSIWFYLALIIVFELLAPVLLPKGTTLPLQLVRFAAGAIYGFLYFFIAYRECSDKARLER